MGKGVGKIASKYARALLQSVEAQLGRDRIRNAEGGEVTPAQSVAASLDAFTNTFYTDKDLNNALLSPTYPEKQRVAAIQSVSSAMGLQPVVGQFLQLLFERGRIGLLDEVNVAFKELADRAAEVVVVEVITAKPVSSDEMGQISSSLAKSISGKLDFQWTVEPEIIGGMLVRYAGNILDGTIRSSLSKVQQSITQ